MQFFHFEDCQLCIVYHESIAALLLLFGYEKSSDDLTLNDAAVSQDMT